MSKIFKINKIYCGNATKSLKYLPKIDLILTDPPYPDYHKELYKYKEGLLDFLKDISCRQLIFWSAKVDFPLDYTAIHIWNKKCGVGSMYERIFERNGGKAYRVFSHYLINSTVAAKYTRDVFTGHKSQKPIALIKELIEKYTKQNDIVFDPFIGSGTTAIACIQINRNFIGIEINRKYVDIAKERINKLKEIE